MDGYHKTGSVEWLKDQRNDLVHNIEWSIDFIAQLEDMKPNVVRDQLLEHERYWLKYYRGKLRLLRGDSSEYTRKWKEWAQKLP